MRHDPSHAVPGRGRLRTDTGSSSNLERDRRRTAGASVREERRPPPSARRRACATGVGASASAPGRAHRPQVVGGGEAAAATIWWYPIGVSSRSPVTSGPHCWYSAASPCQRLIARCSCEQGSGAPASGAARADRPGPAPHACQHDEPYCNHARARRNVSNHRLHQPSARIYTIGWPPHLHDRPDGQATASEMSPPTLPCVRGPRVLDVSVARTGRTPRR